MVQIIEHEDGSVTRRNDWPEDTTNPSMTVGGGFRKVEDDPSYTEPFCVHPEHTPPTHIHLEPGTYEYVCPSCGHITRVIVPRITCWRM